MAKSKPPMNNMMRQVQQMQEQMVAAQAALAETTVEGSAGGGMVTATVTGTGELVSIVLAPEVVDPDDIEMLQDLVVAAVAEATRAVAGRPVRADGRRDRRHRPECLRSRLSTRCRPSTRGRSSGSIDELGRLPGVGPKSAQRIAFHILRIAPEDARRLAASIVEVKEKISWCRRCFNIAEGELCQFCLDERRDRTVICVVEEPRDIVAVERTQEFRGSYHVLQGTISPIEGIGPDQLRIGELLRRGPRRRRRRGDPGHEPEHRR